MCLIDMTTNKGTEVTLDITPTEHIGVQNIIITNKIDHDSQGWLSGSDVQILGSFNVEISHRDDFMEYVKKHY